MEILERSWEQLQDCALLIPNLQELSREKVSGKEISTGQQFLRYRRIFTRSLVFLSEKIRFFSEKDISYDFWYFLCFVQEEEDLWRFHLEAHTSHTCKGILGLCHSSRTNSNHIYN